MNQLRMKSDFQIYQTPFLTLFLRQCKGDSCGEIIHCLACGQYYSIIQEASLLNTHTHTHALKRKHIVMHADYLTKTARVLKKLFRVCLALVSNRSYKLYCCETEAYKIIFFILVYIFTLILLSCNDSHCSFSSLPQNPHLHFLSEKIRPPRAISQTRHSKLQ